jgi:hypothetical protein
MSNPWFRRKIDITTNCAWAALAGAIVWACGMIGRENFSAGPLIFIGFLLLIPLVGCLSFIPLLHWKERYRGKHSTLWGAILLFETSGWFKIVYWLRHIRPDLKNTGRYLVPRVDPVEKPSEIN